MIREGVSFSLDRFNQVGTNQPYFASLRINPPSSVTHV